MTRRRLNRIGRSALQVAYAAHANVLLCPVIFASRYGDPERSVVMLSAWANRENLSPTAFRMSVHNAIGAIFSIERGDTENYIALSAGLDTVPCSLVEANALLADGAPAVLLVVYEDPLPVEYSGFADAAQIAHAWACKVVPVTSAIGVISLTKIVSAVEPDAHQAGLPEDLAVLRFLVGSEPTFDALGWHYARA